MFLPPLNASSQRSVYRRQYASCDAINTRYCFREGAGTRLTETHTRHRGGNGDGMEVHARAFRARSGLTQVVLALNSDCALETLRKLERGDVDGMKVETVMRIAAALGVSPSDLVPALGFVTATEKAPNRRRGSELPAWRRNLRRVLKRLGTEGDSYLQL